MALYHRGENQVEFVPSCPTSRDPSPTREDADLEGVLMGYPNISTAPFTNLVPFKRICFARSKRLVEGTQIPQYLAFTSVSQESFDEIDRIRDQRRGRLPRMTMLYDGREEILIVKLIVGVMHESAACEFASLFDWKLLLLGVRTSILGTGSATFGRRGGRSKEANISYKPRSRRMEDDWPSFVIEVGDSESLAMLRGDAAFWITNTDQRTRIVIVLSINRRDQQILVERWEEVPRRRPNRSTANYSRIPGLMQSLTLNADVEYDGPSLEIPAAKLFDGLPGTIPGGEFLLTPDNLNEFNTKIWEAFR
ncbi:unnamed protein product [Sphagnum jensenii]|uniref:Fungal-type protein kinase domain-containing protein n=1 Tax=Sphagnum jensenii TaxID=128206 RepID=A0ABP0X8X5_9BRYO